MLDWGNSRIPEADRVTGFKDVKIKTGVFFFKLMGTIEPRSIDWENVKPGIHLIQSFFRRYIRGNW